MLKTQKLRSFILTFLSLRASQGAMQTDFRGENVCDRAVEKCVWKPDPADRRIVTGCPRRRKCDPNMRLGCVSADDARSHRLTAHVWADVSSGPVMASRHRFGSLHHNNGNASPTEQLPPTTSNELNGDATPLGCLRRI
jgi:hypothetical protein